jgi:hypothetical protein
MPNMLAMLENFVTTAAKGSAGTPSGCNLSQGATSDHPRTKAEFACLPTLGCSKSSLPRSAS